MAFTRLPYFAGRAVELKRETLVLSSALKNARRSVRTLEMKAHAPDELTLANKQGADSSTELVSSETRCAGNLQCRRPAVPATRSTWLPP